MEAEVFDATRVRATTDCPYYVRRVPDHSPKEHLEMQQILQARQDAQDAKESQQRQVWVTTAIMLVGVVLTGVASAIIGALIGRGILFPPTV